MTEKDITPKEEEKTFTILEAIEYLGISRSGFEKMKLGAIQEYREANDGKKRKVNVYKLSDLEPIKTARETPTVKPQLVTTSGGSAAPVVALADLMAFAESLTAGFKQETQKLLTGANEHQETKAKKPVSVDSWRYKLVLNFSQALILSGIPKDDLKAALDSGKVKAKKRGNRWQIERGSLEKFVSEYFD